MNNNLNNQPVNNQNNLTLIISTVLITALVIGLGIFGYKQFIEKDKEESNKENGNVVQPTATPTSETCSECVTEVKGKNSAKILVGGKIRTVSYLDTNNMGSGIDTLKVDDVVLEYDDLEGAANLYVIDGKYILVVNYVGFKFYDENLNKIDLTLDQENPSIRAGYLGVGNPFEYKNGKIVVRGHLYSPMDATSIIYNNEDYFICEGNKLNPTIADRIRGKVKLANYEISYENGRLISKRISGTEQYFSDSDCK